MLGEYRFAVKKSKWQRLIPQCASGSQIQPTGIKEGVIQAGQVFQRDVNTVIAFIGGEANANEPASSLPMMMIRPLTSPISKLLSGVCNQLGEQISAFCLGH